ncbi:BTAD domain-containing putative transcriptional regulator [Streptomyces sp. NPDC047072]|uniref:AfsR/SARP family transcriptional regulator n=1 Tax=Streptomyces sp. NPDC047072 TaxID=3154809 RepID=UPI0033FA7513
MRFAVLGPVRAWHGDRELALGSPQQRLVLAALLLRRRRPVTVGELVDAVWGEEPPAAAVSVLRTYVSRLRKVLEPGADAAGAGPVIESVADGYRIQVADEALDLGLFERRVAEARELRARGEESAAADLLRTALDDWQGTPLAGLPGPLAESERTHLAERHLTTTETRLDLDVRLGRYNEAITELISLTGRHPLRERLVLLLMLALYRAGRQAEALAAYRRASDVLRTELGVQPGAELRELHGRILAGDPTLLSDSARRTGSSAGETWAGNGAAAERRGTGEADPGPAAGTGGAGTEWAGSRGAETQAVGRGTEAVAARVRDAGAAPAGGSGTAAAFPGGPGPETAAVGDTGSADVPAVEAADPGDTYTARPAQLPADLATFVGRSDELDRVRALLPADGGAPDAVVISVIGGMAGIGKSTLAVHWAHSVAHHFPDGQLYVNLRGFDPAGSIVPPEEAIHVFLTALGVAPERIPAQLDAQAALYRSLLARRRLLIVLDNARDTDQVRPLLPGTPGCLVIVTSRNQLTGLVAGDGAHPLTLDQLTAVEARDLLVRRLGPERPAAEPEAADEIIAHCARLPLALAIVAARAAAHPDFPLGAIAEELRDCHGSLDAFESGDLGTDVRAVFSWSYQSLSAPAARLFHLLGLHVGPDISAPAAAALAGLTVREARGPLGELTRAHLLTEDRPGRYVLHDLLRVYAVERVESEETERERDLAVDRLLAWYLHSADATSPQLSPERVRPPLEALPEGCRPLAFTTREQALDWCESERVNLVAAVHRSAAAGRLGTAWRLAAVLQEFLYLRSHLHDWLDTARAGLGAARKGRDRRGEAWLLLSVAGAEVYLSRFDEAIDHYEQAAAVCEELGDTYGWAKALTNLGTVSVKIGRLDKAVEYSRRALDAFRADDSAWGEGVTLANLGDIYQRLGRYDEAIDCLERALTVVRTIGSRWIEGVALDALGTVYRSLHRHDDAIAHYGQAIEAYRDVRNRAGEGLSLTNLGDVQLAAGERESARASWQQALAIFEDIGHDDARKVEQRLTGPDAGGAGTRTGATTTP